MSSLITTYALPIIQSILASRIDGTLEDWVKDSADTSQCAFNQILMESFISAVKRIKGDSPKIIKEHIDELFDECRDLVIADIRQMESPQIPSYIGNDLYNAFVEELNKRADAVPSINHELLEEIAKRSDNLMKIIQNFGKEVSSLKANADKILQISRGLMSKSGLSACKIVPYVGNEELKMPELLTHRTPLIDALLKILIKEKAIVLYAGVLEGKTVASRLLAKRLINEYVVIEIDLAYHNELNIEYALQSYDVSSNYLFLIDGVKFETDCYENFIEIIMRFKSDKWLFVINTYDKISDYLFDERLEIDVYKIPSLSQDDVNNMLPGELDKGLGTLIFGLFQGQPLLTNVVCAYLKQRNWKLTESEIANLFTFTGGASLQKRIRFVLQRTVGDKNAYNLLNRLLVLDKYFTEKDCLELAGINPVLRNPVKLLEQLEGTWIVKNNGLFQVSTLLRKSIKPDLLLQEAKDCYSLEADKLLQKKELAPIDVLSIMNYLIKAEDYDRAGTFYISALVKLQEQNLLEHDSFSLIKALWLGVPLPDGMSNMQKLAVRCCQLSVNSDLKPRIAENIVSDIEELQNAGDIEKKLRSVALQVIIAYCLLHGMKKKSIAYQRKLLKSNENETWDIIKAKQTALVEMDNIKTKSELYNWFQLYADLGFPQYDMFSEGAIIIINRLCDDVKEEARQSLLKDILNESLEQKACIFSVACIAKLIDIYCQKGQLQSAKELYENNSELLALDFGALLINYSFGLGLYNQGQKDEALPYIEKAARNIHIDLACMVAVNARCRYAQLMGDKGETQIAVDTIREIVNHPCFYEAFGGWEKDAIRGTLAYALWQNREYQEAVSALLLVEHHLWETRNNQDDNYKNTSLRFSILVMFIHCQSIGKHVREDFAVPDYCLFVNFLPNLIQGYKPVRNFTVEEFIYELSERYKDEDTSLVILDHLLDFQKQDAEHFGHFLSVMVQAVPLCLERNRKDIIEYIVLTSLAASNSDASKQGDFEGLVFLGSLHFIVAYRAKCLINGESFDDEWLFGLIDKAKCYLDDMKEIEAMQREMLNATPCYKEIANPLRKEIVALFNYQRVEFPQHLSLLWAVMFSMQKLSGLPSAKKFLKDFSLDYVRFLVNRFPEKFSLANHEIDSFFGRIANRDGIDYTKGIIQGLYFKSKESFYMSKELNDIVNE